MFMRSVTGVTGLDPQGGVAAILANFELHPPTAGLYLWAMICWLVRNWSLADGVQAAPGQNDAP
jgi:hypothetical protein